MICAINISQDATCQEYTKVKPPFLPYDEPNLCNDYILKDPVYIDRSCINFLCHCVIDKFMSGSVPRDSNTYLYCVNV